jgi:hypothetical protein
MTKVIATNAKKIIIEAIFTCPRVVSIVPNRSSPKIYLVNEMF